MNGKMIVTYQVTFGTRNVTGYSCEDWSNGRLRQLRIGPSVFKTKAARQRHCYIRHVDIPSFVCLLVLSVSIC